MADAWRQGDVITREVAEALGLHSDAAPGIAVVASHSCDLAAGDDTEPTVEVILASQVAEEDATSRNGHSIRKLHVQIPEADDGDWYELDIRDRRYVETRRLLQYQPPTARSLSLASRGIFQRWLAQRYSRSEFPDAFNNWLKQSGVLKNLEKLARKYTEPLVGIYFDLEDDTEHADVEDLYALGVYLVYGTENAGNAGLASEAADALRDAFERRCCKQTGWQWIELLYCDAISEQVFSLYAARRYRRWRLEHRSPAGEPFDDSDQ